MSHTSRSKSRKSFFIREFESTTEAVNYHLCRLVALGQFNGETDKSLRRKIDCVKIFKSNSVRCGQIKSQSEKVEFALK